MNMHPLPPGWTERTIWNPQLEDIASPKLDGILAYYHRNRCIIEYYPRWWMVPIWWMIFPAVRRHERGHAMGLRDCMSGSRWCVMYEDEDNWISKLRLLPWKLIGRGAYCECCREHLRFCRSLRDGVRHGWTTD
jgi:hypothetical protein